MSKKMYTYENSSHRGVYDLIPYSLPQFHQTKKYAYVDFYCYDPVSNSMRRKKYHLNRLKTAKERKARAMELISVLTYRLRSGWNVWVKTETLRENTPFAECIEQYKAYCQRSADKGAMKEKTAYGYLSYLSTFTDWVGKNAIPLKFCYQVDRMLITDFLDYVLIDRESSARTRNNHLIWFSSFCTFMVNKGYLRENPCSKIPKLHEEPKKRDALSHSEIAQLRDYLTTHNKHFLLACLMEYYTFIRPIELAQIKLEHISLKEQRVFVPGSISKNKRDGMVGLNDTIIRLMLELRVFDRPGCCYLFGKDFRPSEQQAHSRIFRDYFVKVREALRWDMSKQFYSLKDSGIRDLANAEGIVVARDQARHSDIGTTNKYLKGDSLTVHEETKHFKGAFRDPGEPFAAPSVKGASAPAANEERGAERSEGAAQQAQVRQATDEVIPPLEKAAVKAELPRVEDGGMPPMGDIVSSSETSAQPLHAAEKDKVADDAGESPANKARDFGSLLAGKVAGGKKKRKRILGFKIYSAGGGKSLDAGS